MNKIVPGSFVDKLIARYLMIPVKKYSTNVNSALILISRFVGETPSGFSINFMKQLNSQHCRVTLFRHDKNYMAESGYLPMTICLLFINSWCDGLKHYSFEFLKLRWEQAKTFMQFYEYNNDYVELNQDQEELYQFYHDFHELFEKLSDEQIKALIEYANQ